jgi:hypothetical protein
MHLIYEKIYSFSEMELGILCENKKMEELT